MESRRNKYIEQQDNGIYIIYSPLIKARAAYLSFSLALLFLLPAHQALDLLDHLAQTAKHIAEAEAPAFNSDRPDEEVHEGPIAAAEGEEDAMFARDYSFRDPEEIAFSRSCYTLSIRHVYSWSSS